MKKLIKLARIPILLGLLLLGCEKEQFEIAPDTQSLDQTLEMRGACIQGKIIAPGGLDYFEITDQQAIQTLGGDLSKVRFKAQPFAMPYAYLITDENNVILHVSSSNLLDLEPYVSKPGVYRIWAFSYKGYILAEPGMHIHDAVLASYCYQLTDNYIRVSNRVQFLKQYAPQLKFFEGWIDYVSQNVYRTEQWYPSSVEWAFQYLDRVLFDDRKYWLFTKIPLNVPNGAGSANYDDHAEFSKGNIDSANVYAFWVERPEIGNGVIDLVYFIYYPWNYGKGAQTIFGIHVSDWENFVVRLTKEDSKYKPYKVFGSAHHFTNDYSWADVEKTADGHPIAYVAWGSHGLYLEPGSHTYESIIGIIPIATDYCNGNGKTWDTWNVLKSYDYSFLLGQGKMHRKEGINGTTWPIWMSEDYSNPGIGDPADPASGPIYRWGNSKRGWVWFPFYGREYRVVDGPTGPVDKVQLKDPYWKKDEY